MQLRRGTCQILGVFSFWPAVYTIAFTVYCVMRPPIGTGLSNEWQLVALGMQLLHVFTILLLCGLAAVYFVFLYRTDLIDVRRKIYWAAALVLLCPAAMPVFHHRFFAPAVTAGFVRPVFEVDADAEVVDVIDVE